MATFTIPYALLWRIELGNGFPGPDRVPTDEEYLGVQEATVNWFDVSHAAYYANDESITFVKTTCDLIDADTSWDADADYPHKIQFYCYAEFEADTIMDLPSNIDFILNINNDYDFEDLTRNYLWTAPPDDNMFRYSQRVGYTLTDSGPTTPGSPNAPAPAPTAPAPTPPIGNLPEFSGEYVLPFSMTWEMAVGQESVDRQPSQEAYDAMTQATIDWLTDETNAEYAGQTSSFRLSRIVVNSDPEPTWTQGQQYPHRIPQDNFAIFSANSLDDVPSVIDFLQTVSANYDVTNFIESYLRATGPEDSILREVTLVRYQSSTTSPAGPVNPETPTAPTVPAPTPGAPAPTPGAPDVPAPTMGAPEPAPISPPTPTAPAPAPTREVGPFPTNPPIAETDGVAVLETITAWKYAIGFGIPDRQPFLAEYQGYLASTEAWMRTIYTDAYNNDDETPTFRDLSAQIESAEWDSLADPAHTIILKTQYVFEVDEGRTAPTNTDLLMVISDANLMDYMLNYLHESEPRFNIFIGTKSVTWASEVSTPTAPTAPAPTASVVAPTSTPPPTSAPVMTTAAPVPAPVMPVPAPVPAPTMPTPVENGGGADLSNLDSVRIFMTLELDINRVRYQGDRMEPSTGEWEGLLMATKKFLTDSFLEFYEGNTESVFVGLQQVEWVFTNYDETLDKPYNGELQFDIAFMDGAQLQPNSNYWTVINTFDFSDYLRNYVWVEYPHDSLFHYASEMDWNFINS